MVLAADQLSGKDAPLQRKTKEPAEKAIRTTSKEPKSICLIQRENTRAGQSNAVFIEWSATSEPEKEADQAGDLNLIKTKLDL